MPEQGVQSCYYCADCGKSFKAQSANFCVFCHSTQVTKVSTGCGDT